MLAACSPGFYGDGCNQSCSCRNNGTCHPASGQCSCTAGWTGPTCTDGEVTAAQPLPLNSAARCVNTETWFVFLPECPAGFYGADCRQRCLCQNGATCNQTSGTCTCASGWTGTACERGESRWSISIFNTRTKSSLCLCPLLTAVCLESSLFSELLFPAPNHPGRSEPRDITSCQSCSRKKVN